jgi:hypothetical protein
MQSLVLMSTRVKAFYNTLDIKAFWNRNVIFKAETFQTMNKLLQTLFYMLKHCTWSREMLMSITAELVAFLLCSQEVLGSHFTWKPAILTEYFHDFLSSYRQIFGQSSKLLWPLFSYSLLTNYHFIWYSCEIHIKISNIQKSKPYCHQITDHLKQALKLLKSQVHCFSMQGKVSTIHILHPQLL